MADRVMFFPTRWSVPASHFFADSLQEENHSFLEEFFPEPVGLCAIRFMFTAGNPEAEKIAVI